MKGCRTQAPREDSHRRQRRANIAVMVIIIVMAAAGIALRWNHVRKEAAAAFRERIEAPAKESRK